MSTLLIQGALEGATGEPTDILIKDGIIIDRGPSLNADADSVFSAVGQVMLPGLIDTHVHFRVPGMEDKEDFITGSAAALAGGITTVLDMPNTNPAITTVELLQQKIERAQKESAIDIGCYIGGTTDNLDEIKASVDIAVGVKIAPYFTGADGKKLIDDDDALSALFKMALPMPVVVHCENEQIIEVIAENGYAGTGPDRHPRARPPEAASSAVKRVIDLARGTKAAIHITHISTAAELLLIRNAKQKGMNITCDVTPHHLSLTEEEYISQGQRMKVNPPLRTQFDIDTLWEGVADGAIDIIATDHAPHLVEEKNATNFDDVPPGFPGVQTMLPFLMHHIGEQLTWPRLVEMTATMPAERFALEGKGSLEIGAIADIILVDPSGKTTLTAADMKSKSKWLPWGESITWNGSIKTVIHAGEVVKTD